MFAPTPPHPARSAAASERSDADESGRVTGSEVSAARRLQRAFFARGTLLVAREMLGCELVHRGSDGQVRRGTVVETEAYVGPDDRASHARVGPTGRAGVMFGEAGVAYVYLIYGLHHCFNVVTETPGYPGAVLVRALAPGPQTDRANGPALVCRALHIDRACNGVDLTTSQGLYMTEREPVPDARVRVGPRIGVDYAGEWAAHPWRFWVADSPHVSRSRTIGNAFDRAMLGWGGDGNGASATHLPAR